MIRKYSKIHLTDKYSQHSSIIWPVWLNGRVFSYELSGFGFESSCSRVSNHIIKTINFLHFFPKLRSSMFLETSYISFEYSIKALDSFCTEIYFINIWLNVSKFSNAFVFPDPEPPIINILYGWSRLYGHFRLWSD